MERIFLFILLVTASHAYATPTYLECLYDDGKQVLSYTIDEASQTVTQSFVTPPVKEKTREVYKRFSGFFKPDSVAFIDDAAGMTSLHVIDRMSLSFTTIFSYGSDNAISKKGTCKLIKTPVRKF